MSSPNSPHPDPDPQERPDLESVPSHSPDPAITSLRRRRWVWPLLFGLLLAVTLGVLAKALKIRPPWSRPTVCYLDFKALVDTRMAAMVRQAQARNQTSIQAQDMAEFMAFMENLRRDAVDLAGGEPVLVRAALVDPGRNGRDLTPELAARYGLRPPNESAIENAGTMSPQADGARP